MALLDGKQLSNVSVSLDKIKGHSGLVTFTSSATMSFATGSVLRQADGNILVGTDVVNKNYVDSVAQGLNVKEAVFVISNTQSLALSGLSDIIDGQSLQVGQRVLINAQSASASNGIWQVESGAWTRTLDADGTPQNEVAQGDFVFVQSGNIYSTTGWVLSNTDASDINDIDVDVESQKWTQFSNAGVITAGVGLGQLGVDIFVNAGTGIDTTGDAVNISTTGVASGSYGGSDQSVLFDVNPQGQLTAASTQSIAITSTQVTDFTAASETAIFTDANFVDGITVTFSVTTGDWVTAEVSLGSLTASRFNVINPGSASQGWVIGYNTSGQFEWFDGVVGSGDITEVVAGDGLSGGGVSGQVTLIVNVDNGLSIDTNNVVLGGTLSQNTSIYADGNDFNLTGSGNFEVGVTGSGRSRLETVNGDYHTTFDVYADSSYGVQISAQLGGGTYTGINVHDQQIQLTTSDATTAAQTYIQLNTTAQIGADGSNDNRMIISDSFTKGLIYNGDYTGNFTTHSLVTKQYVDNAVSGSTSQPVYDEFIAVSTSGNDFVVTGVTLTSTPNDYSRIEVYVNGQKQRLGDNDTSKDCYFGTAPLTPIALSALSLGDQLYWNGTIAGFELSTSDKVEIVYES